MRKIEKKMLEAINNHHNWKQGNTEVCWVGGIGAVKLHGNVIAYVGNTKLHVCEDTFRNWPTMTTANRLRALGVKANIVHGVAYVDGVPV